LYMKGSVFGKNKKTSLLRLTDGKNSRMVGEVCAIYNKAFQSE